MVEQICNLLGVFATWFCSFKPWWPQPPVFLASTSHTVHYTAMAVSSILIAQNSSLIFIRAETLIFIFYVGISMTNKPMRVSLSFISFRNENISDMSCQNATAVGTSALYLAYIVCLELWFA